MTVYEKRPAWLSASTSRASVPDTAMDSSFTGGYHLAEHLLMPRRQSQHESERSAGLAGCLTHPVKHDMGSKPVPRRLGPLKGYTTDPYVILPVPAVRSSG